MSFIYLFLITALAFAGETSRLSEIEDILRTFHEKEISGDNSAFSKVDSGIPVPCATNVMRDGYDETNVIDCTRDGKTYPGGFSFRARAGHPLLDNVKSLYPNGGKIGRLIQFVSRDHALNETYLNLEDMGGGPELHDMKSNVFLLPRKVVPSVETKKMEVHVTLNTGEIVVFDMLTSQIKSGALEEGPVDLTTDRFRRQPPNVTYVGTGVSIRLSHRFENPLTDADTAEVKQGSRSCRIQRTELFDDYGKLKTKSDKDLIKVLNLLCPPTSNQSIFRI